jgi:ribulose-phosphate 3-epimerase
MKFPYPLLAPSILGGNLSNLSATLETIQRCPTVSWVHFDIMDGHFVPNLTFGPQVVKELRAQSSLFFDVHLMLDNPGEFVDVFADAGADCISVHVEVEDNVHQLIEKIRNAGCKVFLAVNPETPIDAVKVYLKDVDGILLMSVTPGFCGQQFNNNVLGKIERLVQWRKERGLDFKIAIDGGIDLATGPLCLAHGGDILVSGSAFFNAIDKSAFIKNILGGNVCRRQ